ncbi:hypothetical protein [Streptomyces xanthii]|nr:hypothetical protein [Streptomyces xanthii]
MRVHQWGAVSREARAAAFGAQRGGPGTGDPSEAGIRCRGATLG